MRSSTTNIFWSLFMFVAAYVNLILGNPKTALVTFVMAFVMIILFFVERNKENKILDAVFENLSATQEKTVYVEDLMALNSDLGYNEEGVHKTLVELKRAGKIPYDINIVSG